MTNDNQQKDLVVVQDKIKGMQKMLAITLITSEEELQAVSDKVKQVKMLCKWVEQKKDQYVKPAKQIIDQAKETYDPYIKECKNAEEVLKQRATAYMLEQDRKRKEDEAKLAAKVESGYMKPETAAKKMEAMPEVQKTVRTAESGLRLVKRKVAKIINPNLVPDEYWEINEVRVRREALEKDKAGTAQIPGVEIVEEANTNSV